MAGDAGGLRNCRNCNRGWISRPWPREHAYSCANLFVRSRAVWRGSRPAVAFHKHATMTAEETIGFRLLDEHSRTHYACFLAEGGACETEASHRIGFVYGVWNRANVGLADAARRVC
jgi:hypothetical protein